MKKFILDDIKIAFAEEEDGVNPSFPDDFVKITIEKRKQFKEILEYTSFFGGDVVNTFTLADELKNKVIYPYKLQDYYDKFSYNSANRAVVIYKFSDEMIELSKLDAFSIKAKEKFGTDSLYITYLRKSIYEKDNEELLSLELAVINPKIVLFMEKKEEAEEWVVNTLETFRTEFKK